MELNQFIPNIEFVNANYSVNDDGLTVILSNYFDIKVALPDGLESNFSVNLSAGNKANLVNIYLKVIYISQTYLKSMKFQFSY